MRRTKIPQEATHICIEDCFHDRTRCYPSEFFIFDKKEKVPEHFEAIKSPKEEKTDQKALKMLQDQLKQLKQVQNPSKAHVDEMKEIEEKIKALKGE